MADVCLVSCDYSVEYENTGQGCANVVRGVVRIFDAAGNMLQSDEWELNPNAVIRPGENFVVRDCCFSNANLRNTDSFTTDAFWTNTRCL